MKNLQLFMALFLMSAPSTFFASNNEDEETPTIPSYFFAIDNEDEETSIIMEPSQRYYYSKKHVATPSAQHAIHSSVASYNDREALDSYTKEDTLRNRRKVTKDGKLKK